MKMLGSLLFALCLFPVVHAEVITDGSLGAKVELSGKDFQITPELGQQVGGNLFQSFQNFNLSESETATFSGANSVQNIIARVTGGQASTIDGTLRSTIPNADLYFINPYGILFGQHAQLDLQGGFHASTADYLKLQDGGRFDARQLNNSLLTVAPVASFGFLTDSPAPIQTQSSKLTVLPDKTLSLIGGDIHLTSDIPLTADNSLVIPTVVSESILATQHGRVNLASLATHGEVISSDNDLILQGQGGKIIVENTLVELSGRGGGAAFIRAGQFTLDNAIIRSNTFGNQDGKDINLKVTEAAYLDGGNSEISVVTGSMNNSGDIHINAPYLEISNAFINTGSIAGEAGVIEVHANQVFLKDGAMIGSAALGTGHTGNLTFDVTDRLSLSGFYPGLRLSHAQSFENNRSIIFSSSLGTGQSSNIWVNTRELNLNFGSISADANGTGRSGDINIYAQSVYLIAGGMIGNSTHQMAPAGDIKIQVVGQLYLAGRSPVAPMFLGRSWGINPSKIESRTEKGSGKGGRVDIQANEVILTDGGLISANSTNNGTGDAGEIRLKANILQLTNGGTLTTSAEHAGGGDIQLAVTKQLYLHQAQITTSVAAGQGSGGNITIEQPHFVVLNQAQIKAQADAGHGGNIRIAAAHFVPSVESVVSASSNLGIDGEIVIHSPTEDVGNQVLSLSAKYLNAASLFPRSCAARIADQRPSEFVRPFTFVVKPKTVAPAPEDTRGSPYLATMSHK